jgi:hypothetical protein
VLHEAVLCDDVFKLNRLLDEGADPNAQGITVSRPLLIDRIEGRHLLLETRGRSANGGRLVPVFWVAV